MRREPVLQVIKVAVQGIVHEWQIVLLQRGRKQQCQLRILVEALSNLGRIQRMHKPRVCGMNPIAS